MNPPSLPSPSASSTASYQTTATDPSTQLHHPSQPYQPTPAAPIYQQQPPAAHVPATRSGRHLHLLAPLSNRVNAAHQVPSIRIPANPYASAPEASGSGSGSASIAQYHHHHSASSNPSSGASTPLYLYPPGSAYFHPNQYQQQGLAYPYDDRALRSPHPPLTAALRPGAHADTSTSLWPPPLPTLDPASHTHPIGLNNAASRPYYSSPLADLANGGSSTGLPSRSPIDGNAYSTTAGASSRSLHPSAPPLLPPPTTRYTSSLQQAQTQTQSQSQAQAQAQAGPSGSNYRSPPLIIPPPLTFKYSQSPPGTASLPAFALHQPPPHLIDYHDGRYGHPYPLAPLADGSFEGYDYADYDYDTMPPRRKVGALGESATPQTISSTTSSLRKKPGNGEYRLEHTYDSSGHRKDIIVIDDSESPSLLNGGPVTRKRTRAMAAAEAANGSAHGSQLSASANGTANGYGHTASSVGSIKRRKVDEAADTSLSKKPKVAKVSTSSTYNYQPKPLPKKVQEQVTAAAATSTPWDDAEGHYIIKPDDVVGGRYKIIRLLGQGTFGKVVEAREISTRHKVAIKIIRAVQKYRDASRIEIRVLETLKKHDPSNLNKCVHLEEQFDHRNHPCLVTELYGMSVFDFLKQNSFAPFPSRHIQDFAKSLFKSVDFLHRLKLVHTDLKPENILLCHNDARLSGPRVKGAKNTSILKNTDIRLIDFGSATFENEYHSSVVSTRHYRAPEIILGLPWSYPCDMFSLGCILVEFFTGDALFQTHDNLEHLAMMEVVMGRMPTRMAERGQQKRPEFFKNHRVDYPNPSVSRSSRKFVKGLKSLSGIIKPTTQHNKLFLDLIQRLLDFDPDSRMTVSQALRHPYCSLDLAPP